MHPLDVVIFVLRSAALPVAAIAILNSVLLIVQHARVNRHPALRVYSVRILFMVIVDSIVAVVGLWGTGWTPSVDPYISQVLRFVVGLYESLVIFSFLQFVLVCTGGPAHLISRFKRRGMDADAARAAGKRELKHVPPLGPLLPPWASGRQMLRCCTTGTLSYVVVGAALAVVGIVLLSAPGSEGTKSSVWQGGAIGLSAAQGIAIFSLAELAVNVREELSHFRPYGKFLSVKFVVFFSFWQGLLLRGMYQWGAFSAFNEAHCQASCAQGVVQNALICLEMLAASIIHFHVFPPHEYLTLLAHHRVSNLSGSPTCDLAVDCQTSTCSRVAAILDIRDIFHVTQQVHRFRTRSWGSNGSLPAEPPEHGLPPTAAALAPASAGKPLGGSPSSVDAAQVDLEVGGASEGGEAGGGSNPAESARLSPSHRLDGAAEGAEGADQPPSLQPPRRDAEEVP